MPPLPSSSVVTRSKARAPPKAQHTPTEDSNSTRKNRTRKGSETTPSLTAWEHLENVSPNSSVMLDELHSSPAATQNGAVRSVPSGQPSNGSLFLPSSSHRQSQWNMPEEIDSDDDEHTQQSPATRTNKNGYRKLTDITIQATAFKTPTAPRHNVPSSAKDRNGRISDMYGKTRQVEKDEIETSDSSADEEDPQPTSHIPKTRRAGATSSR